MTQLTQALWITTILGWLIFLPIVWWAHSQLEQTEAEEREREELLRLMRLLKEKEKVEEGEE